MPCASNRALLSSRSNSAREEMATVSSSAGVSFMAALCPDRVAAAATCRPSGPPCGSGHGRDPASRALLHPALVFGKRIAAMAAPTAAGAGTTAPALEGRGADGHHRDSPPDETSAP